MKKGYTSHLVNQLRELRYLKCYWDTTIVCQDGSLRMNRLLFGLLQGSILNLNQEQDELKILLPDSTLLTVLEELEGKFISLSNQQGRVEKNQSISGDELRLDNGMINHEKEEHTDDPDDPYEAKTYNCEFCSFRSKKKGNLEQHKISLHSRIRLRCSLCRYQTQTGINLKRHMNSVHLGVKHKCDYCDKLFSSQGNLKQHVNSIHGNTRYTCDQCEYSSLNKSGLSRHFTSQHDQIRFPCDQCKHQSSSKALLEIHKEIVHLGIKFPCDECKYEATTRGHLQAHKKKKHGDLNRTNVHVLLNT
ncbi:zinc finger protein 64 homolog, isoforms 1 and 2 isoform X1 [Eurytemora carolleeae]|uniref:zinc finger protein 64 homolog, isoforms 1 and 2 isoform X1 n=1 Tax=Eurytemora carolleeae TaxID=1294199 RepID=UPI000C779493|nr:zinc finger protein 64 homolog, isoforms 1 and 2 isoform X1 [Eurytemora carolleeae]|eukprot:XP_023330502.1 zinc finger protein 64 homolog, isoforms 1 and 2-like isoform X1 [Eurytemora affinis]